MDCARLSLWHGCSCVCARRQYKCSAWVAVQLAHGSAAQRDQQQNPARQAHCRHLVLSTVVSLNSKSPKCHTKAPGEWHADSLYWLLCMLLAKT